MPANSKTAGHPGGLTYFRTYAKGLFPSSAYRSIVFAGIAYFLLTGTQISLS